MKIAFETILWGPRRRDFPAILDAIADAGYQGVEIAQRTELLGIDRVETLTGLLEARGLAFLGLAFGTLKERMEFCGRVRPEYLYVEEWDPAVAPRAVQQEFTLALHPRCFKAVSRMSDARKLLREHEKLRFLPDTAHLTIAGDDPVAAVEEFHDRLAAVHLKDWTPLYGWSRHRYARGLTELGEGTVRPERVIRKLRELNYQGWLVVELDFVREDPFASLYKCSRWLAQQELLDWPPRRSVHPEGKTVLFPARPPASGPASAAQGPAPSLPSTELLAMDENSRPTERELECQRAILQAAEEPLHRFYWRVAEAFARLLPAYQVHVWACSPAQDYMALQAVSPEPPPGARMSGRIKLSRALSGEAIASQRPVSILNVRKRRGGRRFGHRALLRHFPDLQEMLVLPIYNYGNWTFVPLIVTALLRPEPREDVPTEVLQRFGVAVSAAADTVLDRTISLAAARVNRLAGKYNTVSAFLNGLARLISEELLDCEGTSIFLPSADHTRLELGGTTGIWWQPHLQDGEKHYLLGEGFTGQTWERKEPCLTPDTRRTAGHLGKSEECALHPDHVCICVPFKDAQGNVVAIVRCRNKRQKTPFRGPSMFSHDDAAILDQVGQVVVPYLTQLLGEERRLRTLNYLSHELKGPLVTIRAVVDAMQADPGLDSPQQQCLDRIHAWTEELRRTYRTSDAMLACLQPRGMGRPPELDLDRQATLLDRDVVGPVLHWVRPLLHERGIPEAAITFAPPAEVPLVRVDCSMLQHALYNLVVNGILHGGADPTRQGPQFRLNVELGRERGWLTLRVRDNGPGLERGTEETIFLPRVTRRDPGRVNPLGQGLGLWFARLAVESHGGTLGANPDPPSPWTTEFLMRLPLGSEGYREGPI